MAKVRFEVWLRDYGKPSLRPLTYESYEHHIRLHITPVLGNIPLNRLTPLHLQELYLAKLAGGRKDGKQGGLSPRSVRYLHSILHKALDQAVKWQMIHRNPSDAVEPPKQQRKELDVLEEAELKRLLQAAKETRLYLPLLLAVSTGMRRGEILGLRWQDVNLDGGVLYVRQALLDIDGKPVISEPKTAKSRRSITLPESTVCALKRHRAEQAQKKLLAGQLYEDNDLVCCTDLGRPWDPTNFAREYRALLKKANLSGVRFHDLRHTHATMLLKKGVHPKIVAERLGHSQISITLDTYSHVLPTMQKEAAEHIDDLLSTGPR